MTPPTPVRPNLIAADRWDIQAMISVRKALELGFDVEVQFASGDEPMRYTPADLPAVYRKITYGM